MIISIGVRLIFLISGPIIYKTYNYNLSQLARDTFLIIRRIEH